MTAPGLSTVELARMLRALAERVESGADVFEISMESETIGHATKTTITLWGLKNPEPAPEPKWCTRLVAQWSGPDKLCSTMLRDDGTCPYHDTHRRPAR